MADIAVRPLVDADIDAAFDVVSRTYRNGEPIEDPSDTLKAGQTFVGLVDGQIKGAFLAIPMTASRGNAVIPCGGIAMVCVAPESRRSGLGAEMMRSYVRYARETGTPLASLYPFRETFYRKAGYEVCGQRLRIAVPMGRFPKINPELDIRLLTPDDYPQFEDCYKEFAKRVAGMNIRSADGWKHKLAERKRLAIYAAGDPVEAYAAVSHDVAFWNEQFVSEFVWSTPRGYDTILSLLAGLGINKDAMAWNEPSDSRYFYRYLDQGVKTTIERQIMFRACDVVGALSQLKPTSSGAFDVKVHDDVVTENNGCWHVEFSPAGVEVTPSQEPGLELDVRAFIQGFLGSPNWNEIAIQGAVQVHRDADLEAALRLMPASPVMCNDFF